MTTVLITGGHKGLSLRATHAIAADRQHDLLLSGRNIAEVERVTSELRSEFGINAKALPLDLSSLASTRAAAAETKRLVASRSIAPLSTLILNAGAQFLGSVEYSARKIQRRIAGVDA